MHEVLAELSAAIDGLGATDLSMAGGDDLSELVLGLQTEVNRLAAIQVGVVDTWAESQGWATDGAATPRAWLAHRTRLPRRTAGRQVAWAKALRTMPTVADAFAAGVISPDHVGRLVKARGTAGGPRAELFVRDEELLVGQASELCWTNFSRVVTYWEHCADDATTEADACAAYQDRGFELSDTMDGAWKGKLDLDPVGGEIVNGALGIIYDEMLQADWAEARERLGDDARSGDLCRTPRQRRADAVIEMARRSVSTGPGDRAPSPLISVLVDYETFTSRVCETFAGNPLTPTQVADLLADDAEIERIVFDGPSRVTDLGRKQRFFTGALRHVIDLRDRTCTWPSCDAPATRCDADHITDWDHGGHTNQDNGHLLCGYHHRLRHRQPWPFSVKRDADGHIHHQRPDGTDIPP